MMQVGEGELGDDVPHWPAFVLWGSSIAFVAAWVGWGLMEWFKS